MTEENLQPVELLTSDLAEPSNFERARTEIYKSTHAGQLARVERLTELAGSMATRQKYADNGEPVNVRDRVLDMLTSDSPTSEHQGSRYRLSVDQAGNITDISRVTEIDEDKWASAQAHRQAAQIPWARKQNNTSMRFRNLRDLPPRRSGRRRARVLQG